MSVENSDLTEFDLIWDPTVHYWNPAAKLGHVSSTLLFLCIGAIADFGLVSFELNGGDPQKRGLTNQV